MNNKNNKISGMVAVVAVAAILLIVTAMGHNAVWSSSSSSPSTINGNRVAMCKEKALEYEQLGYYTGGAEQFNAVIAACSA